MNSQQLELITSICKRPGMYVGSSELRDVYAYLSGMHEATGCLSGFREWLLPRFEHGNNFVWPGVVDMALACDSLKNEDAILRLGELITEFYEFTREPHGLMRVYLRYHAWLLNLSWYDPAWPDYVAPYDGVKLRHTGLREYRLIEVAGYPEWSRKKLVAGESEALIAHLDATTIWITPAESGSISTREFEEFLDDLKASVQNEP